MANKQKNRTDSIEFAHNEMVTPLPKPPAHIHLPEKATPFWDSIINEMGSDDWSPHQLEVAAFLAGAMADYEHENRLLRQEGIIVRGKVNQRKRVADALVNRIMALRRSLSLHARAKLGEARDLAFRRKWAQNIRNGDNELDEYDDYIARPTDFQRG